MSNYKAVIFDLDGTLLNTLQDLATATNNVLSRHNLPVHELKSFSGFIGKGISQLVFSAVPDKVRKNHSMFNALVAEIFTEYGRCLDKHTAPYPGIIDLLHKLNAAGILLAVLSNKEHQFMNQVITTYFPDVQFEAVFGARAGIASKPDPYTAFEIAEIMNLLPEQIIFVGDSEIDMYTAQNARMLAVGVSWGFCHSEKLITSGAKTVISTPLELMTTYFS